MNSLDYLAYTADIRYANVFNKSIEIEELRSGRIIISGYFQFSDQHFVYSLRVTRYIKQMFVKFRAPIEEINWPPLQHDERYAISEIRKRRSISRSAAHINGREQKVGPAWLGELSRNTIVSRHIRGELYAGVRGLTTVSNCDKGLFIIVTSVI